MKADVLIVGAGPAGCVAAILLAREGVRVRLLDRARFPRRKLCGDTINPGTSAMLRRLGLGRAAEQGALRVDGMIVSGSGVVVSGRYPRGVSGLAITRAAFDARLFDAAVQAGAAVEEGAVVTGAVVGECHGGGTAVTGLHVARRSGGATPLRARLCIAADGRHSRVALGLALSRHPARPRRWAIGSYYTDVDGLAGLGEMHIRDGHYVGVAAVPEGLVNVCLVTGDRERLRDPERALREAIATDPMLRDRFARARRAAPIAVMGPLAVRSRAAGMPGLLLAGDAAGFVDPMTGDGLRFAIRGGELAARAALHALATGDRRAHERLERSRREFARKRTFNQTLRALVESPGAIRAAALAARVAPAVVRYAIRVAGDVRVA
ncbi:MAG TPA: NAD(P)/FAD-dependent oxidoreductase [Vicinamibacterales bacterium]|nr:NAD(P)/FAD-dependent oxidoreductase [Vicinamibacterales bacterium]